MSFFYVLSYSILPHALILGPILLIDISISSHYYAQSNEGNIIILLPLCVRVELQTNTNDSQVVCDGENREYTRHAEQSSELGNY